MQYQNQITCRNTLFSIVGKVFALKKGRDGIYIASSQFFLFLHVFFHLQSSLYHTEGRSRATRVLQFYRHQTRLVITVYDISLPDENRKLVMYIKISGCYEISGS